MLTVCIYDDATGDTLARIEAPTVHDALARYLVEEGYDPEATAGKVRHLYGAGPADGPAGADIRCPIRGIVVASIRGEVIR